MRTTVVALVLLLGLGACSSGGDGAATPTTRRTTRTTTVGTEEYCEARLAFETAPDPDVDADAPPDQQAQSLRDYATDVVTPIAERVVDNAPAEIEDAVGTIAAAVGKVAETGDASPFDEDEAVIAALDEAHRFDVDTCEWDERTVTARDYAFEGMPDEIDAGVVSIELANEGTEYHELALVKKKDGVTESFDEILALADEDEQQAKAEFVTGIEATAPESTEYTVVELEPGSYLLACFLSVGSTPDRFERETGVDGPLHVSKGMRRELTVT
jgi:hypothetical protein